jgi:hypothetical protein
MKLCKCGCGREVSNENNTFIKGHSFTGKIHSEESKLKISNSIKSEEVQKKFKITCQQNFHTNNPMQSKEIQEKSKQKCIKHFGVDNPSKSFKIQEKKTQTFIDHFGVDNPSRSKEIKEKKKQTYLEHYGIDNPMQSKEIQEKCRKSCKDHNGFEYPLQSKEIQEKTKLTCNKNFGVDNYSKTQQSKKYNKEFMIQYRIDHHNDGWSPNKGKYEKEIFNELQNYCKYQLLEDQQFIQYHPDRYIKELNLIIELYEPWHKYSGWSKHDPIRQQELINHLHCSFFIIWLKDWNNNKEKVINDFKQLVINQAKEKNSDIEI